MSTNLIKPGEKSWDSLTPERQKELIPRIKHLVFKHEGENAQGQQLGPVWVAFKDVVRDPIFKSRHMRNEDIPYKISPHCKPTDFYQSPAWYYDPQVKEIARKLKTKIMYC